MKMRDSLAISATLLCFTVAPAFAQIANGAGNSNYGGVLNSGPQGQCFGSVNGKTSCFGSGSNSGSAGYSSSVLEQASSLQQRLTAAQAAASERRSGIRAYVRNPQPAQPSAAQVELSKVKTDTLAFLDSIKNPGAGLLGAGTGPAAKYSPTW
jgi:hypothetical protein